MEARMNPATSSTDLQIAATPAPASKQQIVRVSPTDMDVLFGRGMTYQYHPGNVQFRKVLEQHYEAYNDATKKRQHALAQQLYQHFVNDLGVRFLKVCVLGGIDEGSSRIWEEETDKAIIYNKIKHTFRSIRKAARKTAAYAEP